MWGEACWSWGLWWCFAAGEGAMMCDARCCDNVRWIVMPSVQWSPFDDHVNFCNRTWVSGSRSWGIQIWFNGSFPFTPSPIHAFVKCPAININYVPAVVFTMFKVPPLWFQCFWTPIIKVAMYFSFCNQNETICVLLYLLLSRRFGPD
jgi:hypothetical protein